MEDDAIINHHWDELRYKELIKEYPFVYLQRNENEPDQVTPINDFIERPSYPIQYDCVLFTSPWCKKITSYS